MRNKISLFVIAILLPNLTWACADGGSYTEKIIQGVLNWVAALAGLGSIATLIILSIIWSLKKDKENKRSRWWMIFATTMLVFSILGLVAIKANESMCGVSNLNF